MKVRGMQKNYSNLAQNPVMSDHPVILQRNILYSLRHMLRFGLSKADAISKITKEAADIIGQIKPGFKASMVVWNVDPFSLSSHPVLVIGEGRTVMNDKVSGTARYKVKYRVGC